MIGNTDKPGLFLKEPAWFTSIFFAVKKCKIFLVATGLLLFCNSSAGQCPAGNVFIASVNTIYNSTKKNEDKLNKLLKLQQQMQGCNLQKDSCFMYLLQRISVLYFQEQKFTNAVDYTNQSILAARECIKNNGCNTLALLDNYYNLTFYYEATGQTDKKYAAADSCILYALKGNNGMEKAVEVLSYKTDYLFNKGEYSSCISNAHLGLQMTAKCQHFKDSLLYIVSFVMNEANSLYFSKDLTAAENILEAKMLQLKQTNHSEQLYAFYSLLGSINMDRKNFTKALLYYQQGYKLSLLIKFKKGCAQNLAHIGSLYARYFTQYDTGLKYCSQALTYADATDSLFIFKETANIYVLKKMYDKAQYFFNKAFNTVKPGMDESIMLQSSFQFPGFNQLQDLSDLTTDKGTAFVQQYYTTKDESYLTKALAVYKKNDLFLAKIKTEQQLQISSSLVWRTTARVLYEHAIEACYANNNMEDAFYFFEKSRAILLNDQINEQLWMADADISKLAVIKKNITELEIKIGSLTAGSEEYLSAQKGLYNSSEQLTALTRTLKTKNSAFYKNYLDTSFIDIAGLRKNILTGTKTLVEIFSGDSAVYVLSITATDKTLIKINQQLYDSLTNQLNVLIASAEKLNSNFTRFVELSHRLYGLLFPNNNLITGSLIISPDGKSFPFEALVTNENLQQPEYLLNKCATSYTYSAKYLTNQFTASSNNNNNSILGIAPVQYNNYSSLATLEGSDISLKNINTYFSNATNYVFEKATKNNFLKEFPGYNIIQLYAHAADSSADNGPVIYFADSTLFLSELITDRKPITQLVVLSACETANGKLYEGEGIFSFNRGFAALGIPAAVSNLWPVDNGSTYQITELFYKYLSQGLPTDVALQKAKLEFISNNASSGKELPFYWAGTILTGKANIIATNTGKSWKVIAAIIIALSIIAVLTKKYFFKISKKNWPLKILYAAIIIYTGSTMDS